MGGTATLVEAARAKALRVGVVNHRVGRDMPGHIDAALVAGLAIRQVLRVKVVRERRQTAVRLNALLEAAETARNAACGRVLEDEMPRPGGERQHLRNQIEIERGEEGGLLGRAPCVLVEGRVVILDTRVLD